MLHAFGGADGDAGEEIAGEEMVRAGAIFCDGLEEANGFRIVMEIELAGGELVGAVLGEDLLRARWERRQGRGGAGTGEEDGILSDDPVVPSGQLRGEAPDTVAQGVAGVGEGVVEAVLRELILRDLLIYVDRLDRWNAGDGGAGSEPLVHGGGIGDWPAVLFAALPVVEEEFLVGDGERIVVERAVGDDEEAGVEGAVEDADASGGEGGVGIVRMGVEDEVGGGRIEDAGVADQWDKEIRKEEKRERAFHGCSSFSY